MIFYVKSILKFDKFNHICYNKRIGYVKINQKILIKKFKGGHNYDKDY